MLRTTVEIVRVLSWCDLEAHLIKETHYNSLEVLIESRAELERDWKADRVEERYSKTRKS